MNKKDLLKSLMFLFKKKRRKSHDKNKTPPAYCKSADRY